MLVDTDTGVRLIFIVPIELGRHTVFSEDLNHGQVYAGVKVMNPFL